MDEILEILKDNARLSADEIASMTGKKPAAVAKKIKEYEKKNYILKYKTILNQELIKEDTPQVEALIEVQVVPEKDMGFDRIAERIYRFPEVDSCYLLSGAYDLLLVIKGKDIHEVAGFVAEKLAPMEFVKGTATHFMLKRYKQDSCILKNVDEVKRPAISY